MQLPTDFAHQWGRKRFPANDRSRSNDGSRDLQMRRGSTCRGNSPGSNMDTRSRICIAGRGSVADLGRCGDSAGTWRRGRCNKPDFVHNGRRQCLFVSCDRCGRRNTTVGCFIHIVWKQGSSRACDRFAWCFAHSKFTLIRKILASTIKRIKKALPEWICIPPFGHPRSRR